MKQPMSEQARALTQKLWDYCTVLRDDGLSYGDYVEQLTYLLFLKMAYERTQPPWSEHSRLPDGLDWPSLLGRDGADLEAHYTRILAELGSEPGLLGLIFRKSQNRVQDPAKLRRLIVDLIDPFTWTGLDADLKGDAYESLLERNAADTKSGAGQYFTPRPLIQAMTDCVVPKPGEQMEDPAAGTGGFLLAFHEYVATNYRLDRDQKRHLRDDAIRGNEIVDNTARLCAMNLVLHGIGSSDPAAKPPIVVGDALLSEPARKVDVVLANPPFGKKSSMTFTGADGKKANGSDLAVSRPDFWATTSNKQLNFLQHIRSTLKIGGRAAVVLPDNVLFEGGAGAKIRERLLHECDLHTVLRLPTGIFYAQGVKANVVFFERRAPGSQPATKGVWVYDLRTNQHFTLKTRPLKRADLDAFVKAYLPGRPRSERTASERFKHWSYEEVAARPDFNLDIWADIVDKSIEDPANLPAPGVLAEEIVEHLTAALEQFQAVAAELGAGDEDIQLRVDA
ncbi:MAG: N-6 DNA methylase [Solirubrobacteraceae bacterium]